LYFIIFVDISKESLQAALVFRASFMLGLFEGRVANKDLALLAPVTRLRGEYLSVIHINRDKYEVLTADFQYSAMADLLWMDVVVGAK
jgi:hypothetical protein